LLNLIIIIFSADPYEPHLHHQEYAEEAINPMNMFHPKYEHEGWEFIAFLTVFCVGIMAFTVPKSGADDLQV
jgi:hypothetical protein